MFLLLPCATILDKVEFPKIGEAAKIAPEAQRIRKVLKEYSDIEFLIGKVQEGEVMMTKKIDFDNYLKSQVDLMRACVSSSYPCPFSYNSYMGSNEKISTGGLTTKEQWAIEMVMSRLTISSIYHAAAYSSLGYIFSETSSSYRKDYKNSPKLVTSLQIAFKYFNEGYQPLKRLSEVYDTLEQLFSKNNEQAIKNIPEVRREIFYSIRFLIGCNLAYIKLEKYRLMAEYRSCKELAFGAYSLIKDTRTILEKCGLVNKCNNDIKVYMEIGELFMLAYSYYFLLEEHEDIKNKEDYGFIKKEFQTMIIQNTIVCEEFEKLASKIKDYASRESSDNVQFANGVVETMLIEVKRKKYAYGINIHENKEIVIPTIDQVQAARIAPRKIWDSISQF